MGFSRQEYWNRLPFPSPGDLPNPGIEPRSPALQADSLPSESPGKPTIGHFQGPQDPTPRLPREASGLLLLINGLYQAFPDLLPMHPSGACGHSRLSFLTPRPSAFLLAALPHETELLQAGDHVSFAFPSSACQSASTETGLKRGTLKGREPPVGWDGGQKGIT